MAPFGVHGPQGPWLSAYSPAAADVDAVRRDTNDGKNWAASRAQFIAAGANRVGAVPRRPPARASALRPADVGRQVPQLQPPSGSPAAVSGPLWPHVAQLHGVGAPDASPGLASAVRRARPEADGAAAAVGGARLRSIGALCAMQDSPGTPAMAAPASVEVSRSVAVRGRASTLGTTQRMDATPAARSGLAAASVPLSDVGGASTSRDAVADGAGEWPGRWDGLVAASTGAAPLAVRERGQPSADSRLALAQGVYNSALPTAPPRPSDPAGGGIVVPVHALGGGSRQQRRKRPGACAEPATALVVSNTAHAVPSGVSLAALAALKGKGAKHARRCAGPWAAALLHMPPAIAAAGSRRARAGLAHVDVNNDDIDERRRERAARCLVAILP